MTRVRSMLGSFTWEGFEEALSGDPSPVVFLVLGAIEAHGPHLPLETDTIIGEHLAKISAKRLGDETGVSGVLAPSFEWTAAVCAEGFAGTVSVDPTVEEAALRALLEALVASGCRRVCLLTVHFDPAHLSAVRRALEGLEEPVRGRVVFVDLTKRAFAKRVGGEFERGDCHGGAFETSLMLRAAPGSVGEDFASLEENWVGLVEGIQEGKRSFRALGMPQAYCGAPAQASAKDGEALFEVLSEIVVEAIQDAWNLDR